MDNRFLYRSSLKSKDIPKFQMMGITSELILSKQVFPKNIEITSFLNVVFNVEFKNYVMKSRTLILSRTVRVIEGCSENEYQNYRRKLLNFVEEYYESEEVSKYISKSSISKWVTGE
ncbi:hypothetical protein HRG75_08215 [Enterococcus faecalis]|nr:hypothetical protein [Enterococcus faecalis]